MIGTQSLAGILETTFLIYRKDFRSFLTVGLLNQIPLFIYLVIVGRIVTPGTMSQPAVTFLLLSLPSFLAGILYKGAVVGVAEGFYRGEIVAPGPAYDVALRRFGAVLVANAILIAGTSVLVLALILPGFWFYFTYVIVTPIIILEGAGPLAALRRAGTLARGVFFKMFASVAIVGLIVGVAQGVLDLLAQGVFHLSAPASVGFTATIPGDIITLVVGALGGSLVPIALTVLYHDRRAAEERVGDVPGVPPML